MSERVRIRVLRDRTGARTENGARGQIVGFSGATAICLMDDHRFRLYSIEEIREDEPDDLAQRFENAR